MVPGASDQKIYITVRGDVMNTQSSGGRRLKQGFSASVTQRFEIKYIYIQ
jgi:hypothetical protein